MQHAGFCYFIQTIIESPTKSQMLNFKAASCSQEGANTCWRCRWCQHPSLDCSRNWWRRRTGKGRAVDFHDEQTKIDSFFFLVQKYIGEILFFQSGKHKRKLLKIHLLSIPALSASELWRRGWSLSQLPLGTRQGTPWTACQSKWYKQPCTLTPRVRL